MERRKENEADRRLANIDRRKDAQQFVENQLRELNHKRDISLAEKLAAIEKLFNAIMSTKADALAIAISRIQGDNKDCLARCSTQVGIFYSEIRSLRERDILHDAKIDAIGSVLVGLEAEDVVITADNKDANKNLTDRLKVVEDWKNNFWTVQIPALIVLTVTTIGAVGAAAAWILDQIKKLHGG